ncbi:hypothetical protein [Saccharopolyspora pogona]|uniref:hypothetical protein n=1 Tax=Saccharopolyspora pogona TaxID=333966 RepID=UPI0016881B05|nr:hypothetical protein [Saccharopolyspora pogona]
MRESEWSAEHIAAHDVTLDEVREAILERPYWMIPGKNDTTLIYDRTYAGRYLPVVAVDDHGAAFIVTARDMTPSEKTVTRGTVTMQTKKKTEDLPRPTEELEELAAYYDEHDTSAEMEHGQWVDPPPMKTTSLRLPTDVVEGLKTLAQGRGIRYTTLLREIVEQAVRGTHPVKGEDLTQTNERLARIEAALTGQPK